MAKYSIYEKLLKELAKFPDSKKIYHSIQTPYFAQHDWGSNYKMPDQDSFWYEFVPVLYISLHLFTFNWVIPELTLTLFSHRIQVLDPEWNLTTIYSNIM